MNTIALGDIVLANAGLVLANEVRRGSAHVDGGITADIVSPIHSGLFATARLTA